MNNDKSTSLESVTLSEELTPLIEQLDTACSRLERIEAVAELLYAWKQFEDQEVTLSAQGLCSLGNFFREEAYAMRNILASQVMDKLSIIAKEREVSDVADN